MLKSFVENKALSVLVPLLLAGFSLAEVVEDFSDFGAHHGVLILAIHQTLHAIHFSFLADEGLEKIGLLQSVQTFPGPASACDQITVHRS